MNTPTVGWIGLGNMGNPMSAQLIKAGYKVTVYNRSTAKEEGLKQIGATAAATPEALIGKTDIVIIMVSDDKAVEDVCAGEHGLLKANTAGKTIINMSTVSPAINRKMAQLFETQGNDYLDAPVSGSVKQAQDAQLVVMCGGKQTVYDRVKPILEKMGKLALRVGDSGAGNTAKLAMNVLLGMHVQALAEAVLFAKGHGIDPSVFINIMNNSALGNPLAKIKGEAILNDNYKPAFALKHITKDLQLAHNEGLTTPLANLAYQTYLQALPAFGEEDIVAIIKQLQ